MTLTLTSLAAEMEIATTLPFTVPTLRSSSMFCQITGHFFMGPLTAARVPEKELFAPTLHHIFLRRSLRFQLLHMPRKSLIRRRLNIDANPLAPPFLLGDEHCHK